MIWEPISHSSRGSSAFTLPCVPTDMKTGVSTTPCGVVNRPRRARELASVFSNLNMARGVGYAARRGNGKLNLATHSPGRFHKRDANGRSHGYYVCMMACAL